jgi:hypothetical protein
MSATKTHHPRRSQALRLDPYAIEETTLTLEQWRRLREPSEQDARLLDKARARRRSAA